MMQLLTKIWNVDTWVCYVVMETYFDKDLTYFWQRFVKHIIMFNEDLLLTKIWHTYDKDFQNT